jgi:hypothetical protein
MKNLKTYSYMVLIFMYGVFFSACNNKVPFVIDSTDTTPPVLDIAEVQVTGAGLSGQTKKFDIITMDRTDAALPTDLPNINISITATDNESGIRSVVIDASPNPVTGFSFNNFSFRCSQGRAANSTTPVLFTPMQNIHLVFSGLSSLPAPSKQLAVFATSNPIAQIACTGILPGAGPIDMRGGFRVIVTNNAGVTTTSGFFVFGYDDVGVK